MSDWFCRWNFQTCQIEKFIAWSAKKGWPLSIQVGSIVREVVSILFQISLSDPGMLGVPKGQKSVIKIKSWYLAVNYPSKIEFNQKRLLKKNIFFFVFLFFFLAFSCFFKTSDTPGSASIVNWKQTEPNFPTVHSPGHSFLFDTTFIPHRTP